MTSFNIQSYLKRIGLNIELMDGAAGLKQLHQMQVRQIPFENFNILLGRQIEITPEAIWAKLVEQKRGGYCFELNGLMLSAIQSLGYESRALVARVHVAGAVGGRTHQVNFVHADGEQWLCDVGFGSQTLRAPIRFVMDEAQEQDGYFYRLVENPIYGYTLQLIKEGEWADLYSFTLEQYNQSDLNMGNHFASTYPGGHFTKNACAAIQTPNGTITLLNHTLKRNSPTQEVVSQLPAGQGYVDALKTHFKIEVDALFEELRVLEPVAA